MSFNKIITTVTSRYWDCIHIIGIIYNPNSQVYNEAYKCFFTSFILLYPIDSKRQNMIEFIKKYPIEEYETSNLRTFQWTYLLQESLGEEISIENAMKKFVPSSITKTKWGRCIWYLVHSISKYLPEYPGKQLLETFKKFVYCLTVIMPCEICRVHMKEHIKKFPIDKYMINRDLVFTWTVILHNTVNVSLNKPVIKIHDAWLLY